MKEAFITKRFRSDTKELLGLMIEVCDDYTLQGYKLTLRQLYYQLVSADLIPNDDKWYGKISRILNDARMSGVVDWDIIEDRTRRPYRHAEFDGAKELLEAALYSFRLPRHHDQSNHVELWTEKDALTSILRPIVDDYHIQLVVNRGYSSASAMYRSFKRFEREVIVNGKHGVILYLGDHDPSGLDMDRDIRDRMETFGLDIDLDIMRVGLTKGQIEQFNPPPNPAKKSDPRHKAYLAEHGSTSWEVDALKPQSLDKIVRERIEHYIDMMAYARWLEREKPIKAVIQEFADKQGNFDFENY